MFRLERAAAARALASRGRRCSRMRGMLAPRTADHRRVRAPPVARPLSLCGPQLTVGGAPGRPAAERCRSFVGAAVRRRAQHADRQRRPAQVFLNVLRAAFAAHARDSDILLPRVDLSSAVSRRRLPRYVDRRAAARSATDPPWSDGRGARRRRRRVTIGTQRERFDAAVIAVGPHQLGRTARFAPRNRAAPATLAGAGRSVRVRADRDTTYLHYPRALGLAQPDAEARRRPRAMGLRPRPARRRAGSRRRRHQHRHARARASTTHALAQAIDAQLRRAGPRRCRRRLDAGHRRAARDLRLCRGTGAPGRRDGRAARFTSPATTPTRSCPRRWRPRRGAAWLRRGRSCCARRPERFRTRRAIASAHSARLFPAARTSGSCRSRSSAAAPNTTVRGTLKCARFSRHQAMISSGVTAPRPGFERDERARRLAPLLVGPRDHRRLHHLRDGGTALLDLDRARCSRRPR